MSGSGSTGTRPETSEGKNSVLCEFRILHKFAWFFDVLAFGYHKSQPHFRDGPYTRETILVSF